MFNSLRARLLASYLVILSITLIAIGVILIFVLRSRPINEEDIKFRLANVLQAERNRPSLVIPSNGPTRLQQGVLNRLAQQFRFRALRMRVVIANKDGVVSYDSARAIPAGRKIDLRTQSYAPPEFANDPDAVSMIQGELADQDGGSWIVIGQAPNPNQPLAQLIFLAVKSPPPLSINEVIQTYGEDILIPVVEAGIAGLAVAIIMSVFIARSVARPLQEVANAAAAVAQGNMEQRAPVSGPREVRTMAEAFNLMTNEVNATQQAQRDFLANVTHDLKTPLTSIQGFSQAIMDGVASDPAAAQHAAQVIHDEAGRLTRMVQELLDLARIEAGRFNMTRHKISLHDILLAVGERLKMKAAEKSINMTIDVPQLPPIAGDGDRLVQVFTNLIDNAIKHTPSGGRITLHAAPKDGGVLARIRDTGEGIPAEDLPHIFDRFYQVDKSRQRSRNDGAGLGLTITKQIVDAHGGKITVESVEGVGTAFTVWFPALASDSTTIVRRRPIGKTSVSAER